MEKLNIVVLTPDIDLRVDIKSKIENDSMIITGYCNYDDAGKLKISGLYPDVILCACREKIDDGLFAYVHELLCEIHNCVVVLMSDIVNVEIVNKAAEVGIKKVFSTDVSSEELKSEIQKVYALEQSRSIDNNASKKVRSKVIGFFGGKGGTGKTTLALNIASSLARSNKRVMLIDFDLQFGDLSLALDLEPKDTVVELVQDRNGITIENINSFAMVHSTGMSVLCAPKSAEYAEYVTAQHVERIIDVLRPYYEYIVLDLPPAFNDVSISAVENADEIYLVYNMEILSLKNAKTFIGVLEKLHQKDKARIIINKNYKGLIKKQDFESMLEMPIYSTVSLDIKTATNSINKGQPIVVCEPHTVISKELCMIANKIIDEHTGIRPLVEKTKKTKK